MKALLARWGFWLERHDRCAVCTRRLAPGGGTHAFGLWFCRRHWRAKYMGPWSEWTHTASLRKEHR